MSKGDKISIDLVGGPPWGFRLGGGADFGCPLEIAKLRKKSKAFEAGLAEGDVVTFIDHQDVSSKSHGDAMKIIELAGPTLRLEIIKGVGPSAGLMSLSMVADPVSTSQVEDNLMNGSMSGSMNSSMMERQPVEAMVVRSREPSIARSTTERTREKSVSRTLTIISGASKKIDARPEQVLPPKKPAEPWRVDVTSYQFANVDPAPANQSQDTPVAAPQVRQQPRQPPPTSPKPRIRGPQFKASTLPRPGGPSAPNNSCPVIPSWGAPPQNPGLQHAWTPSPAPASLNQNANSPASPVKAPMFKVAKVNASPQKWQPTAMQNIDYANPKHQFNNGMLSPPQPSPSASSTQQYDQMSNSYSPRAAPSFNNDPQPYNGGVPHPPALPTSPQSPRKPANHIPGMVNPLICDDSQGDFGANPIVRPNTVDSEENKSKKMYSDSAFYDSPMTTYPTIQEQVAMAKEISNFLESNQNKRSRGGRMFSRRKQRAEEWTMNSQGQRRETQLTSRYDSIDNGMPAFSMQKKEFGYNQVRHHPDPIKSKLTAAELEIIQHNQDSLCKHDSLPPNLAFDINEALSHSQGKAGQFFEKRRQRAEKYVVDDSNRKQWQPQNTNLHVQIEQPEYSQPIATRPYRSPWEAAAEGRLDSAFQQDENLMTQSMGYPSQSLAYQPQSAVYSPQSQQDYPAHQPLNVITNQNPRQPQLNIKYKTFKPVKPVIGSGMKSATLGHVPSSPMSNTMPRQKTRLEMMLENQNGGGPSAAVQPMTLQPAPMMNNYGNQVYNPGMMQSPAPSNISYSQTSSVYSPVPAVQPQRQGFSSLRRPKDYMRQNNSGVNFGEQAAVSAF